MQSLLILGRQPALGLAELESLYGSDKVRSVGEGAALVDVDPCLLAFDRLGGSVKFCKVLTELDTIDWPQIEKFLIKVSPEHSRIMPEGKMTLGLSLYEFKISPKRIEATGLSIKKAVRGTGRSVRLVLGGNTELSSAQIIHNKLVSDRGWELVFVRDGSKTIIAQTVKVQDIESYTLRDRGRPKRDTRVGMLPPKLAQIIINLAVGKLPEDRLESICEIPAGEKIPRPHFGQTILDPFCGTGVILQEALLMGYDAYGTDADQRMVDYAIANIHDWLRATIYPELKGRSAIALADATNAKWEDDVWNEKKQDFDWNPAKIDFVASETYLGRPFTSPPSTEVLAQTIADCNLIVKKFLRNIHSQLKPGTRLCLGVPAWHLSRHSGLDPESSQKSIPTSRDSNYTGSQIKFGMTQWKHLPLVDSLEELGYNQVSFEHVQSENLIYYRSNQTVARQLLVLIRK